MSRDYKHAASRGRSKAPGGAWLSFISGLGVGLFIAFVFYLQVTKSRPEKKIATPPPVATNPASAPAAAPAPEIPEPEAGEERPPKPRFDFYTILPEMEVKVPEWQMGAPNSAAAPTLEPGAYVLQVASFQRFEEADKAKANLALHGITADIQRVVINGKDTWYRVRIGPLHDLKQVENMRGKLQEADMDFMLLKIKEG